MADELIVSIEKLVYGGDGLAHANGNTVFVPYVLPGEQVRATTKSKRKKLVWAKLPAPPADVNSITVFLPYAPPFEGVTIAAP